jgi:hypothetical protein
VLIGLAGMVSVLGNMGTGAKSMVRLFGNYCKQVELAVRFQIWVKQLLPLVRRDHGEGLRERQSNPVLSKVSILGNTVLFLLRQAFRAINSLIYFSIQVLLPRSNRYNHLDITLSQW